MLLALLLPRLGWAGEEVGAALVQEPPVVDGILDEAGWEEAPVLRLTQQAPHPGEETPFPTEVRVLVDDTHLYLGFTCHDPEPGRVAVHTLQRDVSQRGDDRVAVVLDTFGDVRTGYLFEVNAGGARLDGLVEGAEEVSTDWDGVWRARVHRDEAGWSAELAIPAQSLRFRLGLDHWGLNLERVVPREQLTLRWASPSLDATLWDLRRAGRLAGVGGLRQGLGLSVSPYGLTRLGVDHTAGEAQLTAEVGGDLTYNLTPGLTGVLTVNTDFAETEVDDRQVNLTRFPLFFPEKRAFFLEGSSVFAFGPGLGSDFIPFFSRRIGLYDEEQVPILGGAKLLGRAGRWNLGLLDTYLGRSDQTEPTNLFVGRVSRDVDEHLTAGVIATAGDPDGVDDNALLGADALWGTSSLAGDKNFSVGAWVAGTPGAAGEGSPVGWGGKLDYPNDRLDVFFSFQSLGPALDPALGFLPRPGRRFYRGGGALQPRPSGPLGRVVRQLFFEVYGSRVEDWEGQVESWRLFTAPVNALLVSGEHLEANWAPQFERLDEPFEITDGLTLPAGAYTFTRYRVEAQTSRHRPWRVGATVWFGGFYTGALVQAEGFLTWSSPGAHLQVEAEGEVDRIDLPEGGATLTLASLRLVYAFSPELVLSALAQYDSESGDLGADTHLRWTLRPGADLFLVWSHHEARDLASRVGLLPTEEQVVLKLRWTFRR